MRINGKTLIAMSTAYIEDGILKKWRYYSDNEKSMLHILHHKIGKHLAIDELRYVRSFDNVVIIKNGMVEFINFSGKVDKFEVKI